MKLTYFDIHSTKRKRLEQVERLSESGRLTLGRKPRLTAWPQWLTLFAGVLIQPFFRQYQLSLHWHWEGFWGWALFALVTTVLIFPAVYRTAFDDEKPVVVLLAPIFAAGLGWESLLATAVKAATGKAVP
jgi:hypothetical protein